MPIVAYLYSFLLYLVQGYGIAIVLFLLGSRYLPALREIRPRYLQKANIIAGSAGIIFVLLSLFLHWLMYLFSEGFTDKPFEDHPIYRLTLIESLFLSIIPFFVFKRKWASSIWFTLVLAITLNYIPFAEYVTLQLFILTGNPLHSRLYMGPEFGIYQLLAALGFFFLPLLLSRKTTRG
ncbi:hypothetical protein [Chitinophaga sp. HK235]|uniref:hypothetical protein n=1 Tax=Chitinophaga sp. HK235 TaxID=2952571 RepID=UPI001BA96FCD|nr:hypothetical protein [Chitinophaga sp. HK235]